MNTNMNEISINEMDEISGGVCGLAIAGLVTACTLLALEAAKLGRKIYNNITSDDKK